jgi:hypothetical protein
LLSVPIARRKMNISVNVSLGANIFLQRKVESSPGAGNFRMPQNGKDHSITSGAS